MAVLLATLRPSGVLGDESDSTFVTDTKGDGTLVLPAIAVSLAPLVAAPDGIAFLAFYARVSWWPSGLGPLDPSITLRWGVGATGEVASDVYFVPAGIEQFAEIPTPQVPPAPVGIGTQPNGLEWSLAAVNDLRVGCGFYCDSQGSEELSHCAVAEIWVQVWGNDPPTPEPEPGGPDVIRAAPLRSGHVGAVLAGGDLRVELAVRSLNAPLRSGHIVGPGRPA